MEKSVTFLDLFCGAGGLTLGFERSGLRCVGAVDRDKSAVETHANNFTSPVKCLDISKATASDFPAASVIIGGPPCQGFSSAGMRQAEDSRNDLVAHFARLISELKPNAFVFENVEGFLTASDGHYVFALLRPLIACGYWIQFRKINAANYGVPQHRKRVIIIGGLMWEPTFPSATHSAYGAPGAKLAGRSLPPTPTLDQALSSLPPATFTQPGVPEGHFYRPLQGVDQARAYVLRPGQSMRDLPTDLQHSSFARRAFRRVKDGTPTEKRGGAPTGMRRLRADEPSKAVTGGARTEFLHPQEHRPLTLRECARLQTFPDDFTFSGTVSQQSQLIGNAVPPLLAEAIARNLLHDLQSNNYTGTSAKCIGNGRLLSFVPTLSEGTSPALKRVIKAVRAEFDVPEPTSERSQTQELSLWH
jgi:DNA (cytosine-5)-methyltransferase 1